MFTPQQLDQISFEKAVFGGYDMQSVDEFLDPLLQDYEALYKENATLKSKMRILVEKLEEYRNGAAAVSVAPAPAVSEPDILPVAPVEAAAPAAPAESAEPAAPVEPVIQVVHETDPALVEENQRLVACQTATVQSISSLEQQLQQCLDQLRSIRKKAASTDAPADAASRSAEGSKDVDNLAAAISQSMERLVGADDETSPKPAVRPTVSESVTAKFANLQFGKNYDPTK